MTTTTAPETSVSNLARTLKRLRKQQKMTLQALSKRSGISTATLSKIEHGQLSPTYEKIIGLAKGLNIEVSALFADENRAMSDNRLSINRQGEAVVYHSPQYSYQLLHTDIDNKRFIPLLTTLKAHERSAFAHLHRHEGEEFFYVLSGVVMLHTEQSAPLVFYPGDSCYFDSTMGHACLSASDEDAQIVWVSYPAYFSPNDE